MTRRRTWFDPGPLRLRGATLLLAGGALFTPASGAGLQAGATLPSGRGTFTPISDINANTAFGESPLEFSPVNIRGVAQTGTGALDPFDGAGPSTWFYVSDGTGGLAVSYPEGVPTTVSAGDIVEVDSVVVRTQDLPPIRGTRTVDFEYAFLSGITPTITVIAPGGGVVDDPTVIGMTDLLDTGAAWEGTRVRINGVSIVDPGEWPPAGSSGFVSFTNGVSVGRLYVDEDTDLDGATLPGGPFDLVGFVAQNGPAPGTDHYLYPTGVSDLIAGDGSGLVRVRPEVVAQGQNGLTLDFTITGQEATLAQIEIAIPETWTWESQGDFSIGGDGFTGATKSFRPEGASWVLEVSGAAVSAANPGTVALRSLASPAALGPTVFVTRTATAGGTLTEISASPTVLVVTDAEPGDVVINEVYPVTTTQSQGREGAEYVEIFSRSGEDLDVSGWALADIGRQADCTLDARWAFPVGTVLAPGGYAVVCRNAGEFLAYFRDFSPSATSLLFEMHDAGSEPPSVDDPVTENMVLLDPTSRDDQIALLGGAQTNGGQCEAPDWPGKIVPFSELVVLQDVTGTVVDAIEYRERGPCPTDLCDGGITGPDDAYFWGAPKVRHTLGRDAASRDTDDSRADLIPSSDPTPGSVNVPGDTAPPLLLVDSFGAALSATVIEIRFDEPVNEATALDPTRYTIQVPSTGETVEVTDIIADPIEAGRHFFLVAAELPPGVEATVTATGVEDPVIGPGGGNSAPTVGTFLVPPIDQDDAPAATICAIQEFDDSGFSPLVGEPVTVVGYVTLGDIDPALPNGLPPTDRLSVWIQDPGGCGVNLFSFFSSDSAGYAFERPVISRDGLRLNDFVQIRGRVVEFVSASSGNGAVTEIDVDEGDTGYRLLLRGLEGPEPLEVATGDAGDETLEGSLVHVEGTVVNSNSLAAYVDDGSGPIQVFQNFSDLDLTRFTVGDRLDVTGIITQYDATEPYFSGYELVPQNQDAIFKVDGDFTRDGPIVAVERRVLAPELGEQIQITTRSPTRSEVIVEIFDRVGRKVTTLYDGVGLGRLDLGWNGVDQHGSTVEPGVYICHIRAVALDGGSVKTDSAPIVVGTRLEGWRSMR
jgi:hypothetical protein